MSVNLFSLLCDDSTDVSTKAIGVITKFGGPIAYLIVYSLVLFAVLVWFDSGSKVHRHISRLRQKTKSSKMSESSDSIEKDVSLEAKAVQTSTDPLRVMHISKMFHGSDTKAVDDVSFGVSRDTIFALLGPNGAGKTSTFNVISKILAHLSYL